MQGAARSRFRRYVLILLAIALPSTILGLFWPVIGIADCHGDRYRADFYLAYCQSTEYGDYEHGALFFGLEAEAIRNLRQADILVIANSREQVAFSTHAAQDFATRHGWRMYRLGFGYSEESAFPQGLIRRYHLHPRMVIVNADPFFTGKATEASARLLAGTDGWTDYVRLQIKRLAQQVQRLTCGAHVLQRFTCGDARTIYRSRIDGAWDVTYYRETRSFPVIVDPSRDLDMAPRAIAVAHDFIAATGLDPHCLLLTVVPSDLATPLLAQQVAAAEGLKLIAPMPDGLFTFDHSHLDSASAERWSAQFLQEAEPLISTCLATAPVHAGGS
jgi:hypothetical protein